jgi:hypothetical protein
VVNRLEIGYQTLIPIERMVAGQDIREVCVSQKTLLQVYRQFVGGVQEVPIATEVHRAERAREGGMDTPVMLDPDMQKRIGALKLEDVDFYLAQRPDVPELQLSTPFPGFEWRWDPFDSIPLSTLCGLNVYVERRY